MQRSYEWRTTGYDNAWPRTSEILAQSRGRQMRFRVPLPLLESLQRIWLMTSSILDVTCRVCRTRLTWDREIRYDIGRPIMCSHQPASDSSALTIPSDAWSREAMLSLVPFVHSHRLVQYHFDHVFFLHCTFDRSVVHARHTAWLADVAKGDLGDSDWEWLSLCKLLSANRADGRFCDYRRELSLLGSLAHPSPLCTL